MTSVRTTETHSLLFSFFAVQLFLIIVLALNTLVAYAEPPIGLASSDEIPLSALSVVTIPTRDMPATPMQALSRSVPAIEDFRNCGLRTTVAQHQSTISLQNLSPSKPVL